MSYKTRLIAKILAAKKLKAELLELGVVSVLDPKTGELDINMADNPNFGDWDKKEESL